MEISGMMMGGSCRVSDTIQGAAGSFSKGLGGLQVRYMAIQGVSESFWRQ